MKKVAIIGTQGVPARYGGFESLAENLIGDNGNGQIEYTIFCSGRDMPSKLETYKGCRLKYIPLRANGVQSIPYDICSLISSIRGYDTVLILGVSGCIFLPFFRLFSRAKVVVNIDGLEHRRAKWGRVARWFLRTSESLAVRYADVVIADNRGIEDYVTETYNRPSVMIAYGGDHVVRQMDESLQRSILSEYGVEKGKYAVSVCRIEPENNCHLTLEAALQSQMPLIFIGNWQYSEYGRMLYEKYNGAANIRLFNAIYDIDVLYALRSSAAMYIHGHSAGGTNPSLVEAMFFDVPIVAYDVVYNRETTAGLIPYYANAEQLTDIMRNGTELRAEVGEYARRHYTWQHIVEQYIALY